MVTFTARLRIVEGKEKEALEFIQYMASEVEKSEPGTLTYIFHRLVENPLEILVFEVYQDEAAEEVHMHTPHFQKLVGAIGTVLDSGCGVKVEYLERLAGFSR